MRTDQSQVCLTCLIRFSRREAACPACGATEVVGDLRDPEVQVRLGTELDGLRPASVRALAWLTERRHWLRIGPQVPLVHPTGLVVLALVGGAIGVLLSPRGLSLLGLLQNAGVFVVGAAAAVVAMVALIAIGALLCALIGALVLPVLRGLAAPARRGRLSLVALSPELDGEPWRAEGRVRATATIEAPLSGRKVVACTLRGDGPGGAIADAIATRFEVVSGDRIHVVEAGDADLELGDADVDGDIERWEISRGATTLSLWSPGTIAIPVLIDEAVLRDGDLVELEGSSGSPMLRLRRRSHARRS